MISKSLDGHKKTDIKLSFKAYDIYNLTIHQYFHCNLTGNKLSANGVEIP